MNHTTNPQQTVLRVKGLGKEYKLYASPRDRLISLLTGQVRYKSHWAIRHIDFELRRGQCIGVVGDNGAGKSSLLKLLAGTLQPTNGTIERVGRVTAILELGAGFHPDFSGRDNLYFAGGLIGIDRAAMQRLEAEIVDFCELGDALNRPVKTYSSGMTVRLAFALVTAVQPDVLIIDEALAVGDQHFQKKCIERITAFRENGCTILFCSHSPYHIRQLCDVAMWLKNGEIAQFGDTESVLAAYDVHTRDKLAYASDTEPQAIPEDVPKVSNVEGDIALRRNKHLMGACLLDVKVDNLSDSEGNEPCILLGQDLVITIRARGRGDECPNIGFMIEQSKGVGITSLATHEEGVTPSRLEDGSWQSVLTFPDLPLHSGDYVISAFLFDESGLAVYDEWFQFKHFRFIYPKPLPGLVRLNHTWS